MRIGLTGGIGAGKSAVAARLAARGAIVIDADRIAREVVEPGTPGLASVVDVFGPDVLSADGSLDRAAVAALVFHDSAKLAALESIVHPLVNRRSSELLAAAPADAVVVYDVPLLAETMAKDPARDFNFDTIIVVQAPRADRLRRLVARGLTEADSEARMAAQVTDEQRRAIADYLISNAGNLDDLDAEVDALWNTLVSTGDVPA
ncbi:unannotated protein [freshwater metagenome]|uniref:Unannotated protein n=1 Tax=freshwater metagenome TaxID=449393 RepID=A0A6J7SEC0_9ZZZZ|nr:dephospho-CoA kinase [Actinomycetota bacterium]MSW36778.1 dephospho-CoA kinase [Actinomycetota bacterium]